MDTLFELNDYYVAIIIISIVTISISIALSFYFIFLPAKRIESEIDVLENNGLETIDQLTKLVNLVSITNDEIKEDTCNSIIYVADRLFGCTAVNPNNGCFVPGVGGFYCVQDNPFIPEFCQQYVNPVPNCPCKSTSTIQSNLKNNLKGINNKIKKLDDIKHKFLKIK